MCSIQPMYSTEPEIEQPVRRGILAKYSFVKRIMINFWDFGDY